MYSVNLLEIGYFISQNFLERRVPILFVLYNRWQVSLKETEVQYFWNTTLLVWISFFYKYSYSYLMFAFINKAVSLFTKMSRMDVLFFIPHI